MTGDDYPDNIVEPASSNPVSPAEDRGIERVVALLDRIAGAGRGQSLWDRLRQTDEPLPPIAREIARSPAFSRLYKEARTAGIMVSGSKPPDPGYVGIAGLDPDTPFNEQFEHFFKPRLHQRADGFTAIFAALGAQREPPLILETGCLRIPGNWPGDGQSTFMFDALARDRHGTVISIDITPESIDTARRACSSATQLICNDSVAALHALSQTIRRPADLLYLDSFDLDPSNPAPSALHHLMELTAARPLVDRGTIICVDDYQVGDLKGGKGLLVDRFLARCNVRVLYSGYQKVWIFE
jgi:hypothetical protein